MDQRLLAYYNKELQYLRELGAEFAKQFPKIAGRLGLDEFECADPYVERLLEGFAFLAARVQMKIDAEFPRFTQGLLSILAPHLLAPTPSLCVVEFRPSRKQGALTDGFRIPRGSSLKANLGRGEQTACEYTTSHDVQLWPLEVAALSYSTYVGDLGELAAAGNRTVKSALRLRLRTVTGAMVSALSLDKLPLFLRGPERMGMRLYELLCAGTCGLLIRDGAGQPCGEVTLEPLRALGFEENEAALPYGLTSFQGYRLLHEYFALPSRFQFVELQGLGQAVRRCGHQELEIVILLDRHQPGLEATLSAEHVGLYSTPAINLFSKKADRIHLSERTHEYHVVADRTRPLDFEVHSISAVYGYGATPAAARQFLPFYACSETHGQENAAYYTVQREPRLLSSRRRVTGPRSTYAGAEVFIALVDGDEGPYSPELKQLGIDTLCTNRDLPLFMTVGVGKTDFTLSSGAPIESARCVAGPSEPRASPAWGETSWRLVSQLSLNHLSVANAHDGLGAAPLRELLNLYAELGDVSTRREIEGVRSVASQSVTRRLPFDGPASFARGLEITLDFDEALFEGSSAFLLGAVLDRFFARLVQINSFTATVLRSPQRGEIMRWPTRIGQRAIA